MSSAAPSEAPSASDPCSISVSTLASSLNSVTLTLSTPGQNCSFWVASPDVGVDFSACRRIPGRGLWGNETVGGLEEESGPSEQLHGGNSSRTEVFTCVLDHLEPGAPYQLLVRSQTDDESANVTVHTSEFSSAS